MDNAKWLTRLKAKIHGLLSPFFYQLAKSTLISKIRSHGRFISSVYDICAIFTAWIAANWFLFHVVTTFIRSVEPRLVNFLLATLQWQPVLLNLLWILPAQLVLFRFFGLNRGFWRFASVQDLRKILRVSILGCGIVLIGLKISTSILLHHFLHPFKDHYLQLFPITFIAVLYAIFLTTILSIARLSIRFARDYKHSHSDYQRVIIIGAGNAGESLVRDLLRDQANRYKPVAFLDDDFKKLGREIHNIRVIGIIADLPKFINRYDIDLVLIAIPSASSVRMRSVVEVCEKAKIKCFTLPSIKDLANGHVSINILRSISLEDLLGRYPLTCEWEVVQNQLHGKTILVTGGGGSIGSELCRQISRLGEIKKLIIVDSNEYNLYAIEMELRKVFSHAIETILLNVTDRVGLRRVFVTYQPQLVFHAAAYKHVPMLENQVRVALFNNFIGTCFVAEEAIFANVETFVLISTDKAVNPTNIMGATKRAAEYYCQKLNARNNHTKFITVRFGNVLDSAGSVIPLFRKQIETGGPITVTHPEIVRYFMTIPEASQLILQAAFLGDSGEIFVLDMGDPIKIRYLAEQMIKMAGKTDKEIKIVYTGLRPGEKLYEECFYPEEILQSTSNPKILRAVSPAMNENDLEFMKEHIITLYENVDALESEFVDLLKKLVPKYQNLSVATA